MTKKLKESEKKTKFFTVYANEEFYEKVKAFAKSQNMDVSNLISSLLSKAMNENK